MFPAKGNICKKDEDAGDSLRYLLKAKWGAAVFKEKWKVLKKDPEQWARVVYQHRISNEHGKRRHLTGEIEQLIHRVIKRHLKTRRRRKKKM
eukprot:1944532-Alexandrium_andersonii.AAC.1